MLRSLKGLFDSYTRRSREHQKAVLRCASWIDCPDHHISSGCAATQVSSEWHEQHGLQVQRHMACAQDDGAKGGIQVALPRITAQLSEGSACHGRYVLLL